ncbi:PREDICTED: gap junction alpha-9 protein [Crocodylus porosus]|uniref:Gap junction protein n=1 Tax=Crocodylus porosus TaxID=8502 RepID=A0A7M4E403_CROPO|nr:PREDICTED: gap junction alpha-9 protein [Crocodylus porosus]
MGDWNFLGGILEEVHIHSTIIGKIWLTILFIFRMLVLGVAAEDVWNDEQSEFICNTEQPGCRNVCYDEAFPISLIRYWVLQVIFVSSPSLVYMGHALYRLRALEKERQKKKARVRLELEGVELEMTEIRKRLESELRELGQNKLNKAPLRGSLLGTYVMHIFTRSAVEVGFMIGQYLLYGFQLDPLYKCHRDPCPNTVDCFVSRPTEKTVFILFMQSIATVSLCLNILEIIHLGFRKVKEGIFGQDEKKDDIDDFYVSKSKANSIVPQSSMGTSSTPQKTLPSALSDYTLLMEKPPDTVVCPVLNSPSVFQSIQNSQTESSDNCLPIEQKNKRSEGMQTSNAGNSQPGKTSSNDNETLIKVFESESIYIQKQDEEKLFPNGTFCGRIDAARSMCSNSLVDLPPGCSLQSDIASIASTDGLAKPGETPSLWNFSAVFASVGSPANSPMGKNGKQPSFSGSKALPVCKMDCKTSSRPDTPDSLGKLSSDSKQYKDYDSPQALSPSRQMSLARNTSSRRSPTDLQI